MRPSWSTPPTRTRSRRESRARSVGAMSYGPHTTTDEVLAGFDGLAQHPFRPPCGVLPIPLMLHFALRGRGIAYWSFDSLDYQHRPTQELAGLLREKPPRAGDVVLMHDDSEHTMELLEILLPEWRAQGFAMDALPGKAA